MGQQGVIEDLPESRVLRCVEVAFSVLVRRDDVVDSANFAGVTPGSSNLNLWGTGHPGQYATPSARSYDLTPAAFSTLAGTPIARNVAAAIPFAAA